MKLSSPKAWRPSPEIEGCGTGTIKIRFENSMSAPDPVTGTRQATGLEVFVKGSGTDGLTGVEGAYRTTTPSSQT